MINQNHPFYQIACNLYPKIVDYLVKSQNITVQEGQWLNGLFQGPQFSTFVQNLIATMPALTGEDQMERLIKDNFIGPLINDLRKNMMSEANRMMMMGGGGGGYYGGGAMWGGGRGFPMTPGVDPRMMAGGMNPRMMGGGGSWYSGQPRIPSGGSMFTPKPILTKPAQKPEEKKEPPKPVVKWKEPQLDQTQSVQHENSNNTAFSIRKFVGYDNAPVIEVFAADERPIYMSDEDVIRAYSNLLDGDETGRKFLTVCYRQLKTIKVDRPQLKTLVKAAAVAIGNYSADDVAAKIKAILTVSADHKAGAVEAFHKLIVDEFNAHVYSGELTDASAAHANWLFMANNLHGIYDMLTGSLDKQTRDTLHQVANFDEALKRIVKKVINTVVANGASTRILDPVSDPTVMDIYTRAIPPVWKDDTTNTWEATENFFIKFLASKKTIEGSKTDASLAAENALRNKIALTDRNYSVIQVPRIITWCNCPASMVVRVSEDGKLQPRVYGSDNIDNDIVYLLNRSMQRIGKSKLLHHLDVSSSLICQSGTTMTKLDYGITSDGGMWVGTLR